MPSLREVCLKHARHYLEVANQSDDLYTGSEATQQTGLVLFDIQRGQIDKAREWLQKQPFSSDTDHLLILFAEATVAIGMLRYNVGYERIPHFENQLAAAQRLRWQEAEAEALNNLGITHAFLGYHNQAIKFFDRALAIAYDIADQDIIADTQEYLRMARNQLNNLTKETTPHPSESMNKSHKKEIDKLRQVLDDARLNNDRFTEADALEKLGLLYSSFGDYYTAIFYQEQARYIHHSLGNHFAECRSCIDMGFAHASLGNTKQCVELLQFISNYFLETGFADAQINTEVVDIFQQLSPIVENIDYLLAIQHQDAGKFANKLDSVFQLLQTLIERPWGGDEEYWQLG